MFAYVYIYIYIYLQGVRWVMINVNPSKSIEKLSVIHEYAQICCKLQVCKSAF